MQSPSLEHSQNFTPLFPFKSWSWILNVNESDFWLVGVKKWFTLFYCCNKLKGAQITIVENMNKMLEPGQRSDKQTGFANRPRIFCNLPWLSQWPRSTNNTLVPVCAQYTYIYTIIYAYTHNVECNDILWPEAQIWLTTAWVVQSDISAIWNVWLQKGYIADYIVQLDLLVWSALTFCFFQFHLFQLLWLVGTWDWCKMSERKRTRTSQM